VKASAARDWALVGATFGAVALVAAVWLATDRRPPEWDHANHLERAVLCAHDLERGDVRSALARSSFYPPLALCIAGMAWKVAPSDVGAAGAVVLAFLGLGMAATYVLGRRFAAGAGGVVAAVTFGTAPFVVWQSLRFQLDVPLAAMVALALVVLLRTDNFTRASWSVLAGLVFGLGMLTKPPFAVYVLPPLLLVLAGIRTRRAIPNVAAFAVLGTLVALPWYGPRLLGMAAQIGARSFRQAAESGLPDPLSAAGIAYYPTQVAVQLGVVGVVLFVIGLAACAWRGMWFPLAALLPLLVFLTIQNKNLRYTLPLVPAAAVVAGVGFAALGRHARSIAVAALVLAGGVQVATAAFGVPPAARLQVAGLPLAVEAPPLTADWRQREILARIASDSRGAPVTVSVVPNHAYFSAANFRYYAVRDGLALKIARAWDEPLGIEYMILKTGDVGPPWTAPKIRRVEERLADPYFAKAFPVLGQFPLPDGSTAAVRVRRIGDDVEASPDGLAGAVQAAFGRALTAFVRDAVDLRVSLDYDRAILTGQVRHVAVTAAAATVGEFRRRGRTPVRIHDVSMVFDDVVVNPYSALAETRLDILDVGRLKVERLTLAAPDFQAFLAGQKAFRHASIALEPGALAIVLPQRGPDVSAHVRVVPAAGRPFALIGERVRVGGVPVPHALVDWVIRNFDPSLALAARTPFTLEVAPVRIGPDAIRVGAQ
jgi:hypothetical protein